MGRYTLKLFDNSNQGVYKIPIMEDNRLEEKVNLETIDRFINMSYLDDNIFIKFNNMYELKDFISKYYNTDISNDFDIKITYKKKNQKKEARLDVVYNQSKTIEYFSHIFAYYNKIAKNAKEKKEMLKSNKVWKSFCINFENLISNPLFFEYIIKNEECKEYITNDMRIYIQNHYYNFYNNDNDSYLAKMEAWDGLKKRYLFSYKSIRGIQIVINRFNDYKKNIDKESAMQYIKVTERIATESKYQEWVNKKEGLSDTYLDRELFNINDQMPIDKMIQPQVNLNKKGFEEDMMLDDYDLYQTYEIPDDMATVIATVKDKAQLAEVLFAEGYNLEDILAYPAIARLLGYPENNQRRHR